MYGNEEETWENSRGQDKLAKVVVSKSGGRDNGTIGMKIEGHAVRRRVTGKFTTGFRPLTREYITVSRPVSRRTRHK